MKAFLSRATLASVLLGASMLATAADGIPRSAPPEGAKVFIVSPKDGSTVDKIFTKFSPNKSKYKYDDK